MHANFAILTTLLSSFSLITTALPLPPLNRAISPSVDAAASSDAIFAAAVHVRRKFETLKVKPRAAAACSSDVQALVSGINKNIAIQKQELGQAQVISDELAQATPNTDDVASSESKLVDIVNSGISVRQSNQEIAPSGNAAIAGLSKIATAQATELNMAESLTGRPSSSDDDDDDDLATLRTMFSDGITQNMQNARDAAEGCTMSAGNGGGGGSSGGSGGGSEGGGDSNEGEGYGNEGGGGGGIGKGYGNEGGDNDNGNGNSNGGEGYDNEPSGNGGEGEGGYGAGDEGGYSSW